MDLGIADDDLATCVACGLCLPHCPTYRVTGEEALSPRGRVAAMRQVQWAGLAADDSFVHSIETCVQCRGCETACPSGVPFGRLIEPTRATLAEGSPSTPSSGPRRQAPRSLRLGLRTGSCSRGRRPWPSRSDSGWCRPACRAVSDCPPACPCGAPASDRRAPTCGCSPGA